MAEITLLSRPGCHLCEDARAVIERVAADLGVPWTERDITQSPADLERYWEMIPVTLIDGVQHDYWRGSEDRLRGGLSSPYPPPPGTEREKKRAAPGRTAARPAT